MGNRVSISRLCRGCMNVLESPYAKCDFCGFDRNEQVFVKEHLRLECILRGKYLVGKCVKETDAEKTYIGWNLSYDTKVVIKEYFSKELMSRESYESGKVVSKKNVSVEVVKKNINKFIAQAELMAFASDKKINITEIFRENGTGYYVVECLRGGMEEGEREVKSIADFELIKPSEYEENGSIFSEQEDIFANRNLGLVYNIQPAKSRGERVAVKKYMPDSIGDSEIIHEKTVKDKNKGVRYIDIRINDDKYIPKEIPNPVTVSFKKQEETVVEGVAKDDTTSQVVVEQLKKFVFEHTWIVVGTIMAAFFFSMIVGTLSVEKGENSSGSNVSVGDDFGKGTLPVGTRVASEKFLFSDPGGCLEQAVCISVGKSASEITVEDVQGIKILDLKGAGVTDVSDLEKFVGLVELDISDNPVGNIDVLAGLPQLTKLTITGCGLSDVSALNSSPKLAYVNALGCKELVPQLKDIDFVVGRREKIKVQFIYSREDENYDDWSMWVWTATDPGGECGFKMNADGTAYAENEYLIPSKNEIGFKLKKGDWLNGGESDRSFVCAVNKPGTLVKVYIRQGTEDITVEYGKVEE